MTKQNQSHTKSIGPRGWAIMTLAGGAALASPFLKSSPPEARIDDGFQEMVSGVDAVTSTAPTADALSGRARDSAAPLFDSQSLPQGAAAYRSGASSTATGYTDRLSMPEWAPPASLLDDVIAQGTAAPPPEVPTIDKQGRSMTPWTSSRPQPQAPSVQDATIVQASSSKSPFDNIVRRESQNSSPYVDWPSTDQLPFRAQDPSLSGNPGALAGASITRSNTTGRETVAPLPPKREPKYVYQPGMRRE